MAFEWALTRNLTRDFLGTLYDTMGAPFMLQSNDVLRFRLFSGDDDDTPFLDIQSGTPATNGSRIDIIFMGDKTNPAQYTMMIDPRDVADLPAGVYDAEISVLEAADQRARPIDPYGVVHILAGAADMAGPAPPPVPADAVTGEFGQQ
jgi:hypothetical protein